MMPDASTDAVGLSTSDRNDLRAFVRRVRDGTAAGFADRRIGDTIEESYPASPAATVFARETHDATLELGVTFDSDAGEGAFLPGLGPDGAALADTLVAAINDAFDTGVPTEAIRRSNANERTFVVRFHVPAERVV